VCCPSTKKHVRSATDTVHVRGTTTILIGVDLAGLLRGTHGKRRRLVGTKCSGVWGGVSFPQQTRGSGERCELSQRGPKTDFGLLWRPQNAPFCTCITKSEEGGNLHSSPIPNSGGLVPAPPP